MDSICAQNPCKLFETQPDRKSERQKTCRNAAGRARGHYGAGSALQEPHTARPNQSSVGMASTNPRGGSMGLQGPPYAVLSPLVTDPLAPPGDPESSLFLTCHFVGKGWTKTNSPDWAKLMELMGHPHAFRRRPCSLYGPREALGKRVGF